MKLHFLNKNLKSNIQISHHTENEFLKLWHYHPESELVYIKEGKGTLIAGDFTGNFRKGDLFLLGKELPHMFYSESNIPSEAYVLHIDQSFFKSIRTDSEEFQYLQMILNVSKHGTTFQDFDQDLILKFFTEIQAQPVQVQAIYILQIFHMLTFQSKIKHLGSLNCLNYQQVSDNRLTEVMDYLKLNFRKDISLETISNIAGMNKTAFCRFFKQNTGKSFVPYLNELRINYSCKLLKGLIAENSISSACYQSGFNSFSYYNRIFKKLMGITPSEYLREHKKALIGAEMDQD